MNLQDFTFMTLDQIKKALANGDKVYWTNKSYQVKEDKKCDRFYVQHISGSIFMLDELRVLDRYKGVFKQSIRDEGIELFESKTKDNDLCAFFDSLLELDDFCENLKGSTPEEICIDICEKLVHKGECTKVKEGEYLFKIEVFKERPEITYTIKLHDTRRD